MIVCKVYSNLLDAKNIYIQFRSYKDEFVKEWREYQNKTEKNVSFLGSKYDDKQKITKIIVAKGKTAKDQINFALEKGMQSKGDIQFHFEIQKKLK